MYILVEYLWGLLCCMFKSTVSVTPFSRIDRQTSFGGYNKIGRNCIIEKSSIGRFSYIGNNCVFTNTHIGNFCSISSNVEILGLVRLRSTCDKKPLVSSQREARFSRVRSFWSRSSLIFLPISIKHLLFYNIKLLIYYFERFLLYMYVERLQ